MGVSTPAQDVDEGHVDEDEAVATPVVGDLRDEALVPDQWLPREVPQQIMRDLDSYQGGKGDQEAEGGASGVVEQPEAGKNQ